MSFFVESNSGQQPELCQLKAGEPVKLQGIVIHSFIQGEKNKIIEILTSHGSKLSLFAKNSVNSKKRFATGLEPGDFSLFNLKVPRAPLETDPLWILNTVEQQEAFLMIRKSYALLDHSFLAASFIRDMLPKGNVGVHYFYLLAQYLKFLNEPVKRLRNDIEKSFYVFWSFAAIQDGFSLMSEKDIKRKDVCVDSLNRSVQNLDFTSAIKHLANIDCDLSFWKWVYNDWVQNTGRHWPFFEKRISR